MKNENQVPAGSEPINPIMDNSEPVEQATVPTEVPAAEPVQPDNQPAEPKVDETAAKFEKMLADSQQMIGKQSSEIGALRAQVEELSRPKTPAGPSEQEQLREIYSKMDEGEMDIAEGMRRALEINSELTAKQIMDRVYQQQQQSEAAKVQGQFLEKNPDYNEVLESGALDQYLKDDPMADEYVAFIRYKADQDKLALQQEYEEKIRAAKEEGAKLAKGAEDAGKVIGRQGGSAQAPQAPKRPWKSNQEASNAMMETLKSFRSTKA